VRGDMRGSSCKGRAPFLVGSTCSGGWGRHELAAVWSKLRRRFLMGFVEEDFVWDDLVFEPRGFNLAATFSTAVAFFGEPGLHGREVRS